jgi:hypothetical protein
MVRQRLQCVRERHTGPSYNGGVSEEVVSLGPPGRTIYTCPTGHDIEAEAVRDLTEVCTLDGGAVVRLCREHGVPVALTIFPLSNHG